VKSSRPAAAAPAPAVAPHVLEARQWIAAWRSRTAAAAAPSKAVPETPAAHTPTKPKGRAAQAAAAAPTQPSAAPARAASAPAPVQAPMDAPHTVGWALAVLHTALSRQPRQPAPREP
jgi:hypothetical protein